MDIKDFKVGQTVYIELTGNAKRGKTEDELIEEWEITSVGRKIIKATTKKYNRSIEFINRNDGDEGLWLDRSGTCVNYILYANKQELEDAIEMRKLFKEVTKFFL